jgi:hypothetical protein
MVFPENTEREQELREALLSLAAGIASIAEAEAGLDMPTETADMILGEAIEILGKLFIGEEQDLLNGLVEAKITIQDSLEEFVY